MLEFKELIFKEYDFRVRIKDDKKEIFDVVRRKWVRITPEEWVRQNIVRWLQDSQKVPFSRISLENGVKVNGMNKRTDIVVYDENLYPEVLIECKAPNVNLDEKVLAQAMNYNRELRARFVMITNGVGYELKKII